MKFLEKSDAEQGRQSTDTSGAVTKAYVVDVAHLDP